MELQTRPWKTQQLFNEYYLTERFLNIDTVNQTPEDEVTHHFEQIKSLYTPDNTANTENEFALEDAFIKPVLDILGHSYETQKTVQDSSRRPDYGFFPSDAAANTAFERDQRGEDFYEDAVAVGDAKRWGLALDDEYETRTFDNPAYQIHVYLEETKCDWGILTNGRRWRLYYEPDSYDLDTYYEVDLGRIIEAEDEDAFKYFYFFFRQAAFTPDESGTCFLDKVYQQSASIADELSDDLKNRVYDALEVIATGVVTHPENDIENTDAVTIQRSAFLLLYRLMFVLYAEHANGLLPADDAVYTEYYSVNALKHDIEAEFDAPTTAYTETHTRLWDRLNNLFSLLSDGTTPEPTPTEEIDLPVYGRRLFGTDTVPGEFLSEHVIGDLYLARAIQLITRAETASGNEVFVDYNSLNIQHLGSIYEEFIEYDLKIADEPLIENGTDYTPVTDSDNTTPDVTPGDVYFVTDNDRQSATGSFYTPDAVTTEIVDSTVEAVLDEIRAELESTDSYNTTYAGDFTKRVLALDIVDPAMGSGHFLVGVIEQLAEAIMTAQSRQMQKSDSRSYLVHDIDWARRQVAQNCIYGVDRNPFAVQLAKLSVWLRTGSDTGPLVYLDDRLRVGNSLVGWSAPPSHIPENESQVHTPADTKTPSPAELNAAYSPASRRAHDTTSQDYHLETDGGHAGLQAFVTAAKARCSQPPDGLDDIEAAIAASETVQNHGFKRAVKLYADTQVATGFSDCVGADACDAAWDVLCGDRTFDEVTDTEWYAAVQDVVAEYLPFHWWVEFPEVFADALLDEDTSSNQHTPTEDSENESPTGVATADTGFDAVIGNPPHMGSQTMQEHLPQEADYYREVFTTPTGNFNLYVPFVERGYTLLNHGGFLGYIQPHKFFHAEFGEPLREFIATHNALYRVISFGHSQVWGDVATYTCLLFLRRTRNTQFAYTETTVNRLADGELSFRGIPASEYDASAWVFHDAETTAILDTLQSEATEFDDLANIYVGLQTSADSVFIVEPIEEKLTTTQVRGADGDTWEFDKRMLRPYLYGKDVHRYEEPSPRKYVIFPYRRPDTDSTASLSASHEDAKAEYEFIPEDELATRHPQVHEYLTTHKDTLLNRSKVDPDRWYDFGRPQNLERFDKEKLLTPSISYESNFTHDEVGVAHKEKVYGIRLNDDASYTYRSLLAVLNSNIPWYYLLQTGYTFRDGFRTFKTKYLGPIPIPEITPSTDAALTRGPSAETRIEEYLKDAPPDTIPPAVFDEVNADDGEVLEVLDDLAAQMLELRADYDELSVEFTDHVPVDDLTYESTLEERATTDLRTERKSILTSTRDSFMYDGLRVGDVEVEYEPEKNQAKVLMAARFKPDDEDAETDPYGYTTTDELYHVFTLGDVSELEAELYCEFIPHAVDEGNGVAGFREKATKSHTLLDRLRSLQLPAVDDVREEMLNFRAVKNTSITIETRIQKIDALIDQLVYGLYGLSATEISTIEETVSNHRNQSE
ncbi:Eco57I restriction-modification methylase domain-containing protein [Salinibaculum rarum]|uniref:Eco57I restriction-modification methylase domain-containing protein n=1 Tax=Salinibaculum rarum TaxID=3058903 RepID=UPI00265E1541|nr:TaqI-like C-terminal specificity domain-containing protein [Salinibaculum sp. KK48]